MPRIARKNLNTPYLHVMVQGINKEYIFDEEWCIKRYLNIIYKNKEKYQYEILAYCIMNNHAHFLIYTEKIEEFSKAMHTTNLSFAQMYNREKERKGVIFRNRYKSEPIYDEIYLINCIKYIHNNPVNAKMVEKCEEYKYSSYRDYINNTGITKNPILENIFGKDCNYAELFENIYDKRFIDIEDDKILCKDYFIKEGILEFSQKYNNRFFEIFSDRVLLKRLIKFLVNECGIKYAEIIEFFEFSKNVMDGLKK